MTQRTPEEEQRELIYVPGHWQCPKCSFYQVSSILHPNGISPNRETPEQCPNDGTEMMPVTWRQNAQDGRAGQERLMERINELEQTIQAERAAKRKCEACGGTDLTCYKGHIESTDKLKKELAKEPSLLDHRNPKYQEVLKLVNKHGFDIRSDDTAHEITKDFLKWHEAQRGKA